MTIVKYLFLIMFFLPYGSAHAIQFEQSLEPEDPLSIYCSGTIDSSIKRLIFENRTSPPIGKGITRTVLPNFKAPRLIPYYDLMLISESSSMPSWHKTTLFMKNSKPTGYDDPLDRFAVPNAATMLLLGAGILSIARLNKRILKKD